MPKGSGRIVYHDCTIVLSHQGQIPGKMKKIKSSCPKKTYPSKLLHLRAVRHLLWEGAEEPLGLQKCKCTIEKLQPGELAAHSLPQLADIHFKKIHSGKLATLDE